MRAALVWMLFMLAETGSGMVREVFIAPVLGALRARQLTVGAFWVILTLAFEFALGRATGASWSRILSDYNPTHGGFMLLGLAFMFITPWLTRKLR